MEVRLFDQVLATFENVGFPQQTASSGNPFPLGGIRALIFLSSSSNSVLNVSYNFAHTGSATSSDQFRIGILVDGQVTNVLTESGSGSTRTGEFIDVSVAWVIFAGSLLISANAMGTS